METMTIIANEGAMAVLGLVAFAGWCLVFRRCCQTDGIAARERKARSKETGWILARQFVPEMLKSLPDDIIIQPAIRLESTHRFARTGRGWAK